MKKNGIDAFEGMNAGLEHVMGGFFTRDTEKADGTQDCDTVTEPGDTYGTWYNDTDNNYTDATVDVETGVAGGGDDPQGRN